MIDKHEALSLPPETAAVFKRLDLWEQRLVVNGLLQALLDLARRDERILREPWRIALATDEDDVPFVSRWVEADGDVAEARLIESVVPVWALIGHLRAVEGDMALTAKDYGLPVEAVRAAQLYYQAHQAALDTRLAANAA